MIYFMVVLSPQKNAEFQAVKLKTFMAYFNISFS